MEKVVDLLIEKNECLAQFKSMNDKEMSNFAAGNFENLESFYKNREGLLLVIQKIDEMIQNNAELKDPSINFAEGEKKMIETALSQKKNLVHNILAQDLQILSIIEEAKSGMIRELSQVKAIRKAFGTQGKAKTGSKVDESY